MTGGRKIADKETEEAVVVSLSVHRFVSLALELLKGDSYDCERSGFRNAALKRFFSLPKIYCSLSIEPKFW